MKTVQFELDKVLPETGYYCTCCKNSEIDHSGTYVPLTEAEAEIANWKGASIDSAGKFMEMLEEAGKQRDRADKAEAEIAALRERQRVLVEALESMIVVCKEPQSYDFVKVAEIIRDALAAKEG